MSRTVVIVFCAAILGAEICIVLPVGELARSIASSGSSGRSRRSPRVDPTEEFRGEIAGGFT